MANEIKLTAENAFVGAKIKLKDEEFLVVKVNAKSLYITKTFDFLEKWEVRPKGTKWKDFCNRYDAFMVKYGDYTITEEEVKRKEEVAKIEENKSLNLMTPAAEKIARGLWTQIVKKSKGNPYKGFRSPFDDGNNSYVIIADNVEKEIVLVHNLANPTGGYFFYKPPTREFAPFSKEENKKGNEILWPTI